jgi:hypothetical protein
LADLGKFIALVAHDTLVELIAGMQFLCNEGGVMENCPRNGFVFLEQMGVWCQDKKRQNCWVPEITHGWYKKLQGVTRLYVHVGSVLSFIVVR